MDLEDTFRIESTSKHGRFMVSSRDLKSGDVVLRGIPYSAVVDTNFKKTTCNNCLKFFGTIPKQKKVIYLINKKFLKKT
jgi:hypothetical protein